MKEETTPPSETVRGGDKETSSSQAQQTHAPPPPPPERAQDKEKEKTEKDKSGGKLQTESLPVPVAAVSKMTENYFKMQQILRKTLYSKLNSLTLTLLNT